MRASGDKAGFERQLGEAVRALLPVTCDMRDLGAFDVPRLGAPAREVQVLLEKGFEN
jgi:hypothetical protein